MAQVKLGETTVNTSGELPAAGSQAPDFRLVTGELADVSLATCAGKKKIISIVPSLDTEVCATSTRKLNERAAGKSGVVVLVVSADLPFAQKRFCTTEGIDNVVPLSMMRSKHFAKDYGVLMTEGPMEGVSARAVLVLDESDKVLHAELVPEIGNEPDYDAALAAPAG
jgi:thiol peroxidase